MKFPRRSFLGAICLGTAELALRGDSSPVPDTPIYDFHVHLLGMGTGGTGCFLSDLVQKHWNFPFFLKLLGLRKQHLDQDFVATLVQQLRGSSTTKAVLLAHD